MEYLTAMEISKKWSITSRMVAYYCEAGRIEGAIKKGKVWFIPSNAEKPVDKRFSRKTLEIKPKEYFHGEHIDISKDDIDNISLIYHTNEVSKNLGLTRETLRYYEDLGLIKPKRSQNNLYRDFDFFDVSRLMAIDFYKKRGFSPNEIKKLIQITTQEEYTKIIEQQIAGLQNNIEYLKVMLKRLKTTKKFYDSVSNTLGQFEIRDFPLYYVRETINSVSAFAEYRDKILNYINLENEDILSNMVRTITFDETGYIGSEMCIAKLADKSISPKDHVFLENGKCLYTTLIADNNDNSIMEKMFDLSYEWATKHNVSFRGVVYIFIRFILLNEETEKNYYEVWIPIK